MGFGLVPRIFLLVLLLVFTLPFHILSTCMRRFHGYLGWRASMQPSVLLVSIPVICLAIIAFSGKEPPPLMAKHGVDSSELEELKLKLAKLETAMEDNTNLLYSKVKQLKENNLLMEEMELNIQHLQNSLNVIKKSVGCTSSGKRIDDMEQEVEHLWFQSRKNNLDQHSLELETRNAEKKLKLLTSQLHKVEDIIAEQWIQIRQVERGLQLRKMRISKDTNEKQSTKTFLEFVRKWCKYHVLKNISIVCSHLSAAFHNFKKFC